MGGEKNGIVGSSWLLAAPKCSYYVTEFAGESILKGSYYILNINVISPKTRCEKHPARSHTELILGCWPWLYAQLDRQSVLSVITCIAVLMLVKVT